jgi:hypothetical protein
MAPVITAEEEHALAELRAALLRARPPALGPDQGDEAFRQHKLIASAVHRTSRLDARGSESETDAWVRYVSDHFPSGRNDPTDARLLFGDWRTSLLKEDSPGPRVPVTHGQSHAHWQRDGRGRLCINLEDMWTDYERSVDHFVAYLSETPDRRSVVLGRWRQTTTVVEPFLGIATASAAMRDASVMASRPPFAPLKS